jgi:hypothetical protein
MYEDNVNAEDNKDGGNSVATPTTDPAESPAGDTWPDSLSAILLGRVARSEVPARRYWLQFLDAPLAREIRAAGALNFDELARAVPRILRCDESRVNRETIQEWWEYSERRSWLEPVGSLWRLSDRALGDLREEHERVNSPDPKHMASGLARWVIPTSLVGFAGLASGRYLVLEAAILVMAGVIVVGLLLAAATSRVTDSSMDRWFARRACDWLEGRRVPWAFGANRQPANFVRLYDGRDTRMSSPELLWLRQGPRDSVSDEAQRLR